MGGGGLLGGRARAGLPAVKKLTGAEKNDAKYWLPGTAESTKVLNVQVTLPVAQRLPPGSWSMCVPRA